MPEFLKGHSSFTYYDFKPTFDKDFAIDIEDVNPAPETEPDVYDEDGNKVEFDENGKVIA